MSTRQAHPRQHRRSGDHTGDARRAAQPLLGAQGQRRPPEVRLPDRHAKFSKVSLFSGLNHHLLDITLHPGWSALCGYTDADVDRVFAPELPGLDRVEIGRWYNGYNWGGDKVCNPFDLLLFENRIFQPYRFATGAPTFLVDLLTRRQFFTPDPNLLSSFDVDRIEHEALLFQTGYLTPHGAEEVVPGQWIYTLGYPNQEVESSLNAALLSGYGVSAQSSLTARQGLIDALKRVGRDGAAAACPVRQQVFIFEFKVVDDQPKGEALRQIKAQGYADKYLGQGEPVHLIGIEFSRTARNLVGFEVETLDP